MIEITADFNNKSGLNRIVAAWPEGVGGITGNMVRLVDAAEGFTVEGRIDSFDSRTGLFECVVDWSTLVWPDEKVAT